MTIRERPQGHTRCEDICLSDDLDCGTCGGPNPRGELECEGCAKERVAGLPASFWLLAEGDEYCWRCALRGFLTEATEAVPGKKYKLCGLHAHLALRAKVRASWDAQERSERENGA